MWSRPATAPSATSPRPWLRAVVWCVVGGSAGLVGGCYDPADPDRDGFTSSEGDCNQDDADIHPRADDPVGDGRDQNCDGTDLATVNLEDVALGFVYSEHTDHTLGYSVSCGADVDGNGVGDLAFNAETFTFRLGDGPGEVAGIYRTNGPVLGDVREDRIDGWFIHKGDASAISVGSAHALVGPPFVAGLLFVTGTSPAELRDDLPWVVGRFATRSYAAAHDIHDVYRNEDLYGINPLVADDLTGDGHPNIVIGGAYGYLTIWDGPPEGDVLMDTAPRTLAMEAYMAGRGLDSGDLNGDGAPDLAFANQPEFGRAADLAVAFGPFPLGTTQVGEDNAFTVFGAGEAGASGPLNLAVGDFDADGIDDLAAGEHLVDGRNGGVWVFFGPLAPGRYELERDADLTIGPETPWGWLGTSLAAADFDGDGTDSLVIGSSMDAAYGQIGRAGLVYILKEPLIRGELVEDSVAMVLQGPQRRDDTGWSIGACDTDGNGRDELIVGAPAHDLSRRVTEAGRVYWVGELDVE